MNKKLKFLIYFGIFSLSLIVTSIILFVDFKLNTGFLDYFFNAQSLSIMGTILGISLASATFLISQLLTFELNIFRQNIFSETKKEIKQDVISMIIIFCAHFFLMLFVIYPATDEFSWIQVIIKGMNVLLWCLFVLAFTDLTNMIFKMDRITQNIIGKIQTQNVPTKQKTKKKNG